MNELYLELMIKCLTNEIYGESEYVPAVRNRFVGKFFNQVLNTFGFHFIKKQGFNLQKRHSGLDWPPYAHTMVGRKRLENTLYCVKHILENNIDGDFIETGVWRGGSTIFMRAILKTYNVSHKTVWVADSFEGLPAPNEKVYPDDMGDVHYTFDELKVTLDSVRNNFKKYDLLDDQVKFLKGWFKDTLPTAPIEKLSLIRLDGDMYESTMDAIVSLYPKLSPGGFLIVDDYCIKACSKAIADYRAANNITEEIIDIDGTGVYWQKAR